MTSFCADNLSTKNYKAKLKVEKSGQKSCTKKHLKKYGDKMLVKLIVEILRCSSLSKQRQKYLLRMKKTDKFRFFLKSL